MTLPDFFFETEASKKGFKIIAGIDEVGRGAFAGPVVAGCIVFSENTIVTFKGETLQGGVLINDSKKLTAKQRENADKWIRKNCLACGVGSASVAQINKYGIKKATEVAFRKAISEANTRLQITDYSKQLTVNGKQCVIDFLLVDAFNVPRVRGIRRNHQRPIIKGDMLSFSIASASIIAKVYRDKYMVKLGKKKGHKNYKWDKNKGYGTLEHRKAILKHGLSRLHRKTFVNTWLLKSTAGITSIESNTRKIETQ